MNNLEAKQEAIKKAYGEYYNLVEKYLNGFLLDRVNFERETGMKIYDLKNIEFIEEGIVYSYPAKVEGFQNNNGWKRIESEDDLPNHKIWLSDGKDVWQGNLFEMEFFAKRINTLATHYQPIEKPKPPIY